MKILGYAIITAGFLCAALASVLERSAVRWDYYAVALLAGAAGVVMVRYDEGRDKRAEHKVAANLHDIEQSLARIVGNMARLNAEKLSINPYEIRHRIDELFSQDLEVFVEARDSLAHAYGLAKYAELMSHFASGQRYLNRVWSASADGYVDEVNSYLGKSQARFTKVLEMVRELAG